VTNFKFPNSFLFGAATSAHQVEGNNCFNDWWEAESTDRIAFMSGDACRHYELFEKDFDLAQQLHHSAHRFSIEWSRIEPTRGKFDTSQINHYEKMIDALRARNIEPIVTLHHFTLPIWLAKEGGWAHPESVAYFVRYAEMVTRLLDKKVKWWITINEPLVLLYQSYIVGEWPPFEKSFNQAFLVMKHLLQAHVQAYQKIKTLYPRAQVGLAKNMIYMTPCRRFSLDAISTKVRNYFFNHLFLKAIQKGKLDVPGVISCQLPVRDAMDFIGVNYYWRDYVHHHGFSLEGWIGKACSLEHHRDSGPRNMMDNEIYAPGLKALLLQCRAYHKPILIAENGICTEDDAQRQGFIHDHLNAVAQAMQLGVPVFGYLYWSLLDNFEWDKGFRPRFGLIEVDFQSQKRSIRPSAHFFRKICESREIS